MGCNCKTTEIETEREEIKTNFIRKMTDILLRIIGFILSLAVLPFIIVGIIWFMFDKLVLNNEISLHGLTEGLKKLNSYLTKKNNDDEDDDLDDDLDEKDEEFDDLVTINVEEIIKK